MPKTVKLYGPPGTGKTLRLTAQAMRSVDLYGPDRVCALTYTCTAADELKTRIATARGLVPPPDGWARRRYLSNVLPWIGTIHSLSLKLAGGTVMNAGERRAFVLSQGGQPTGDYPDVDDLEGYEWAEPGKDEVEAALNLWAAARHRMLSIDQMYTIMPWDPRGPTVEVGHAAHIVAAYEDYKRQTNRIDFEDMLERGRREMPDVDVVLADEVQDNSPLLWSVVDAWSVGRYTALAGDPYQAIYLFQGAAPDLFIRHPGELIRLGDSRRLTASAAERAQSLLRAAGHADADWLGTWTGVGAGAATDGSAFYLARTGRLLGPVTDYLQDAGEPYGYVRGGGPLESKAANAFRTLEQLRKRGAVPAHAAAALADACGKGVLIRGTKAELERLAKQDPEHMVGAEAFGPRLKADVLGLPHGAYYERVLARHGIRAFVYPPRTRIGTIHSAKGREADTVHLVDSWATLPYRRTLDPQGALEEACVAYVATTRHRVDLQFVPASEGTPYPGF